MIHRRYRFSTDPSEGKQYDKKERDIFSKVSYTREKKEEETKEKEEITTKPPPKNTGGSTQTTPTEDPYGGSTDEGSDMEVNQPGGLFIIIIYLFIYLFICTFRIGRLRH